MKSFPVISAAILTFLSVESAFASGPANFAGEYADKKFMNGAAILQLSLEQTGSKVSIFFSGVRHDGQGAAPEFDSTGTVTGKGAVEFKFEDGMKNSGTGTITRAGDDVLLSLKPTHVADPRCLPFYGKNMRLTRLKK